MTYSGLILPPYAARIVRRKRMKDAILRIILNNGFITGRNTEIMFNV
jgi:hypothetical protein